MYELGHAEFKREIATDFARVQQIKSTHTLPSLQFLSRSSVNARSEFARVLPKRTRRHLLRDPQFFTEADRAKVDQYLSETGSIWADPSNTEYQHLRDAHRAQKQPGRVQAARRIQRILVEHCLEASLAENVQVPEPFVVRAAKRVKTFELSTQVFMEKPYELSYGHWVRHDYREDFTVNEHFLGIIGLGATVWFYSSETEAVSALKRMVALIKHFSQKIEWILGNMIPPE
jgi:hypothetical protein